METTVAAAPKSSRGKKGTRRAQCRGAKSGELYVPNVPGLMGGHSRITLTCILLRCIDVHSVNRMCMQLRFPKPYTLLEFSMLKVRI